MYIFIYSLGYFIGKAFPNPPHVTLSSNVLYFLLALTTVEIIFCIFLLSSYLPLNCNVHIHLVPPTPVFLTHYRQSVIFEE